ncbi:MAG: response regulator [Alphaproteobacteria bacterium]|nr:response regulator [Alphaproteobacteria bacterium]
MDENDELRLLRGACAASQTGAWSYRVGEDLVEWTPLLHDLFAVPRETELTLKVALSFYLGKSRQQLVEAVKLCLRDGTGWTLDVQCRSTTGRIFWARTIGEAILEEGRVVALQGAFQDISRERAAIDERARAQAELSFVLRTMPDGFFLLDTDWRFSFVNAAAEQMLLRDPTELVGQCVWEEFPEARGTIFEHTYRTVRETGVSQSFQAYFEPLETWFHVTAHPAQTGVAVHYRNVTREVGEQRDLRLFRTAIDAMASGAIMLERGSGAITSWPIVYANATVGRLWKLDERMLLGTPLSEAMGETACCPDIGQIGDTLAKQELCHFEARRQWSGRQEILECVAVPLAGEDGQHGHAVILINDVTEQRRTAEERHRSERLALIGQMAGGVSHDFNNLLAVILGNVELLELTDDPAEARILISEARDAVMRGKSLNDSLLAFAGKSKLTPQTADLGTFLQSVAPFVRRAIPSRIKLELEVDEVLPPVLIDAAMAESCLLNVAINARESIEGTGTIRITLKAVECAHPNGGASQTWVRLSVQDTGCGIPEQLQGQVFEPFFTTRSVGQGSGLGLSRVRGYLEQIGGFVTLSSAVEQGTTVSMHFAVAPVDTRDVDAASPSVLAFPKRRLKALVVDDTPAVARVVARMLTSLGCTTLIASNGQEARDILNRETGLDLVISDVVMPGESGLDLAQAISRMYPSIRVALMSGYTQEKIQTGDHPDAIAFLAKPVSRAQLQAFLEASGKWGL